MISRTAKCGGLISLRLPPSVHPDKGCCSGYKSVPFVRPLPGTLEPYCHRLLQRVKALPVFSILRSVDDLGFICEVSSSFPGECSSADVTSNFLTRLIINGLNPWASLGIEAAVPLRHDEVSHLFRYLTFPKSMPKRHMKRVIKRLAKTLASRPRISYAVLSNSVR